MTVLLSSCGLISESTFLLDSNCRIPKWFNLPVGMTRSSVSVKMSTYIGMDGRFSEFTLYNSKNEKISTLTGKQRGLEPISLMNETDSNSNSNTNSFTSYEVVTADGITDVVKYVYMKNRGVMFCMLDDPSILKELGVAP